MVSTVLADIREVFEFKVLKNYIADKDTLIALDLDNTLIEPKGNDGLGGEAWITAMMKAGKVREQISPLFDSLQNKFIKPKLVESYMADEIKSLQKKGVKVIGITGRTKSVADQTVKNLKKLGIKFYNLKASVNNIFKYPCTLKKGILFCDQNSKGEVLKEVLKQTKYPLRIIAMDDKKKYLVEMEEAVAEINKTIKNKIEFFGLHYLRLNNQVATFDLEKANSHLKKFGLKA